MSHTTDHKLFSLGKPMAACEIYVVANNQVLMHKRSSDKQRFPGYLLGPGGMIEADEDPLTATVRELAEETGVVLEASQCKLKAVAFHIHQDRQEVWCEYLYLAKLDTQPELIINSNFSHEGEALWIDKKDLLTHNLIFPMLVEYLEYIINDIPGIIHANIVWNNMQLVKVNTKVISGND